MDNGRQSLFLYCPTSSRENFLSSSFAVQVPFCDLARTDLTRHTKTSQITLRQNPPKDQANQLATMDYSLGSFEAARRGLLIPHIDDFLSGHAQARTLATPAPPLPHPQTTTPPSARALVCAAQVADTPELTELILKHLSARQLISATRVNQTFRNLIHTSPVLQRITFMRSSKPTIPIQHCQFVQWGPGLQQRHLKPLPQPSTADDTPIVAIAKPEHQAFHSMPVLYSHAVQMSLLCPLLEPAERGSMDAWSFNLQHLMFGVNRPARTTARFSEKLLLIPTSPWARLQIIAHDGGTAAPAAFGSATMSQPENHWTRMQLSTPPTRHARVKLCWEGRLDGQLRMTVEATRYMHRTDDQSGITLRSLLYYATTSQGHVIMCDVPSITHHFMLGDWCGMNSKENSSLIECIDEIVRTEPGCRYVWSVAARSEVTLDGVVVPTESELEILAETDQLSSTPAPLVFHFMEPGAEEDDDDADDEDGSESGSDSVMD